MEVADDDEGRGVADPPAPLVPRQGSEEHERRNRNRGHGEGVWPSLLRVAGDARQRDQDEPDDGRGTRSRAVARRLRGCPHGDGHRQRRRQAQGQFRVSSDVDPEMEDGVVRGFDRVGGADDGAQHRAERFVGVLPRVALVDPERRPADADEENGQRGQPAEGRNARPNVRP